MARFLKITICVPRRRRLFARRAPPHYSIIPTFHHSNCERRELISNFPDKTETFWFRFVRAILDFFDEF
jgi:hypothetical protein